MRDLGLPLRLSRASDDLPDRDLELPGRVVDDLKRRTGLDVGVLVHGRDATLCASQGRDVRLHLTDAFAGAWLDGRRTQSWSPVAVSRGSGPMTPIPPFDIDPTSPVVGRLARCAPVPSLTLTVAGTVVGASVGAIWLELDIVDGTLARGRSMPLTHRPRETAHDLTFQISYRNYVRHRAGEIDVINMLDGGGVSGPIGALMAIAGLLESRPWREAWSLDPDVAQLSLALVDGDREGEPWT